MLQIMFLVGQAIEAMVNALECISKQDLLIFKVKLCREKERKRERKYQLTKSYCQTDKVRLTN